MQSRALPLFLLLAAAAAAAAAAPAEVPPPPPPPCVRSPPPPPPPLHSHLSSSGARAAAGAAGSGGAPSRTGGRKLKQLTVYASTPSLAASASGALNANRNFGPDGTVYQSGGASGTASAALANPLLRLATRGGYDNRPEAATAAYVTTPLILASTLRPTIAYGLGEARGDVASGSAGGYTGLEFNYNPISNNLGTSVSSGTAASGNLFGAEELLPGSNTGLSGVEFIGTADDQTRLGKARTAQMGQAIAYPFNVLNPVNPLTCAQVLTLGITVAKYDLNFPAAPLPRNSTDNLAPLCLSLFNFNTLDDFSSFLNSTQPETTFDENGDGLIGGTPITNITDTTGNGKPAAARAGPALSAGAPQNVTRLGDEGPQAKGQSGQQLPQQSKASGQAGGAAGGAGSGGAVSADRPASKLPTFADQLDKAVRQGTPAVAAFFNSSAVGKALLARAKASPLANNLDGAARAAAGAAGAAAAKLDAPLRNLSRVLGGLRDTVARSAAGFATRRGVAGLDAAEPLVALRANLTKQVAVPVAAAGKRLADLSFEALVAQVEALPEGPQKYQARQVVAARRAKMAAQQAKQQEGEDGEAGEAGEDSGLVGGQLGPQQAAGRGAGPSSSGR